MKERLKAIFYFDTDIDKPGGPNLPPIFWFYAIASVVVPIVILSLITGQSPLDLFMSMLDSLNHAKGN